MSYVHTVPIRKNSVLHILRYEVPAEVPEGLEVGQLAEMHDVAVTICGRKLNLYEVVETADMKMCYQCEHPEESEEYGEAAIMKRYANVPSSDALKGAMKELLKKKRK